MRRRWRRYMPVMPASASAAHQHLRGLADRHLGGDEVRDVGRRVVDLDADEDRAGGGGAEAGGAVRRLVVMVMADSFVRCRAGCPAMYSTLGIDVVSAHHHVM